MEVIINFVKWFSELKPRAIALVFMIALFIGMGGIIYYQHKQAVKNDEIAKRIDRQYQLDIRNITNRCDSINRVRETEIYEIQKQNNETLEKVYNDYRDLYLKSQELKSRY
jgi:hypothetical protein